MSEHGYTLRRLPALLAAALLLVAGLALAEPQLPTVPWGPMRLQTTTHGTRLRPGRAVADRLLVRFTPALQLAAAGAPLSAVGGQLRRSLGHGLHVVDLPAGSDLATALGKLRAQPGVAAVEPDLIMYPALVPNDPEYSRQYHLPLVTAPAGWDVTTGASNVVIAVIDSGCDLDHPDLASKIWINPGETPNNGRDDDRNGYIDDSNGWDFYNRNKDPNPTPNGQDEDYNGTPDEQVSHGTLVAGLAAAAGNDGWGCAGVAWGARIMPLQVFPDDGGTAVSTVVEAINYAVANGADIINLSIGGSYTSAFTAPLAAAYAAGVVVVSAAGNGGDELTDAPSTWDSPVCNDGDDVYTQNHVIGVAATDRFDRKASYSNFDGSSANFVDVSAPGEALYGPNAYFPAFPAFASYFGTNSGTSFSAPLVSGLAALALSLEPSASPARVLEMLRNGCDSVDETNPGFIGRLGAGRVNVARTLGVTLAPGAARDLLAADTAGDDGGSITLTWRRSQDDGAGADSVQFYQVLRREAEGTMAPVATLPAGSEMYVDTAVSEGVDYYYAVRASDGHLTSDTAAVGPVQARNDAAPPDADGVTVADRPNDSGGAIRVRWTAYTAPADFQEFVIYRATRDFSTTTGLTPLARLSNPAAVQYVDATASDGVDYYYAVGTCDIVGNENRALRAQGPVQSFPNGAVSFPAGLQFIGAPIIPTPADPAALFGVAPAQFRCARWLPDANGYLTYTGAAPLPEALQLGLARGFWVNLPASVQVQPDGQTAPAGDLDLDLTPGWHMLANPFLGPIDFAEATVTFNGATMDLASAQASGVLSAFAWMYDTATQDYALAFPHLEGQNRLIAPWKGFWVQCLQACRLTLVRPLGASSATVQGAAAPSRPRTAGPRPDWTLPVVATTSASRSRCLLGSAAQTLTAATPPAAHGGALIAAAAAGPGTDCRYAVSLAQTASSAIIWNLRVTRCVPGQAVRVTWPDLSRLGAEWSAVMQDTATGQTVNLRAQSAYEFTPRAGESSRALRLTVSPRRVGALTVQGLTAQQSRSGGAQVTFTLSQPAACTVAVMNLAGRTVRRVETTTQRAAGLNTALWDGRNDGGSLAPAGFYLLQVEAKGSGGENIRAMVSLRLQR